MFVGTLNAVTRKVNTLLRICVIGSLLCSAIGWRFVRT